MLIFNHYRYILNALSTPQFGASAVVPRANGAEGEGH